VLSLRPPQEHISSMLWVRSEIAVEFVAEVGRFWRANRREAVKNVLRLHMTKLSAEARGITNV
jgi:hypothetical protein